MSNTLHEIQAFLYQRARTGGRQPLSGVFRQVTDWAVLKAAWRQVARKGGGQTMGQDQRSAAEIQSQPGGERAFLQELAEQLQTGRYRPGPVRRFELPKPKQPGKTRPLAILTLADRVVHTAVKLALEPILEARLGNQCFGFRPGLSRYDQLQAVRRLVQSNGHTYTAALTADIAACFDQLDHRLLGRQFHSLVADRALQVLFDRVLQQVGTGQRGWWRKRPVGVLQGSPLSPLLANLALAHFDRAWHEAHGPIAPAFRYADDLIVLAADPQAARRYQTALSRCLWNTCRLGLAADKTAVATFQQGVPLLGMKLQRGCDPFEQRDQVRVLVDPERVRQIFAEIDGWAERLEAQDDLAQRFADLNLRLRGWFATYQYAYDAPQALAAIDYRLFRTVRARLKQLLGCSAAALQAEHHVHLPSGHPTWQYGGEALLVLSSLPRRAYRPKLPRLPWEPKPAAAGPLPSLPASAELADSLLPPDLLPAPSRAPSATVSAAVRSNGARVLERNGKPERGFGA